VYSCYILLLSLFKCRYDIRDVQTFLNLTMFVENIHPVRLNYFSANKQCFPLTTNQHKHQHKPNFSISKQGD
jgi:hypothetical protein